MKSAIYEGVLRHRRFEPRSHAFAYKVFMMYLDLDEIDEVFSKNRLWSLGVFYWVGYRRKDYFGDLSISLDVALKRKVFDSLGFTPNGPVRMLTNLRFLGFIINPITIYYFFDSRERLVAMLLEVTNTPWREKHQYVINCDPDKQKQRTIFKKQLHVSPFMPMEMEYRWFNNLPGKGLTIHMINANVSEHDKKVFDATLALKRIEISTDSLTRIMFRYPTMTFKVGSAIYLHALMLFIKKISFFPHPKCKTLTK